jgi:ribonucleoside-diphosphate reductase alpha chain
MITEIVKRNGTTVPFDQDKIVVVMKKAFAAENVAIDDDTLAQMTDRVVAKLELKINGSGATPTVEEVQDLVEETLMERGYFEVAKAFILYRFRQSEERAEATVKDIEEHRLSVTLDDGSLQPFSREKLKRYLMPFVTGYEDEVHVDDVIEQVEREVYDGIRTNEIAKLVTLILRARIERDPAYSVVAARQLCNRVARSAVGSSEGLSTEEWTAAYRSAFVRNVRRGVEGGKLDARMLEFDLERIAAGIEPERDDLLRYLGTETLNDRYFIRLGADDILETPQMLWMRVAMGLSLNESEKEDRALAFYEMMSTLRFVPSTPTLFHAGTPHPQLSSCYLNVVEDDLGHIFKVFGDNAQLAKWAGGIGTAWSKLRATGALIKAAGITSQGTVPFLKIANDVTVAINRSGRRRGATCVYMENWHYDFPDFLELRKNTGDERRRTHDMNTAAWVSDLFMKRVREDGQWTLLSPDEAPELTETYGKHFEELYTEYEAKADRGEITLFRRVKARDLWKKHLSMLFETGHPWVTFKDPSNIRSPQDHAGVVHSSNLCTEITLNTSAEETAVCNLGSVNFARHMDGAMFDEAKVRETVGIAMRMLDNVIDLNFYPTKEAKNSNIKHRPVGLGIMGFQDALYLQAIPFASEACIEFSDRSMEIVAHAAILASTELARERGRYESFAGSKWDRGILPLDTIKLLEEERGMPTSTDMSMRQDWEQVRRAIKEHGMRNSNCMAIAPTATISNISGTTAGIEPIYKNIYVKSNISGDFIVVNNYLVTALKERGLWSEELLEALKLNDGSVQDISAVPDDIKHIYRETFEIGMHWLVRAAAARGKWIDQSQSLNIFYAGTSGKDISDLYLYAWEMGLKTTYYLRSLGASQVEKSTVNTRGTQTRKKREGNTDSTAGEAAVVNVGAEAAMVAASPATPAAPATTIKTPRLHVTEDAVCESCQ